MDKYIKYYEEALNAARDKGRILGAGGQVRATTGSLVENLAELIWVNETGGEVRKETYTASNTRGDQLDFSVDRHCYTIDGELKMMIECKAYLDRCYMARAHSDFTWIQGVLNSQDVKMVIFALENATTPDAIKFYTGLGSIDEIFFLLDGKRKSSEPIWKDDFRKEINKQKLQTVIDYVNKIK